MFRKGGKIPSNVIFFIGAGFSKPANVPLMSEFVTQFAERIKHKGDKFYKYFISIKEELVSVSQNKQIDLEVLMDIIGKLVSSDAKELSLWKEKSRISRYGNKVRQVVKIELEELIREKCVINPNADLKYLEPLIQFIESNALDIFSVNYDDVIEVFCHQYQYNIEDGFALYWDPERFQKENVQIRLYKLHGSVLWYKTDQGAFYKVLLRTPEKSELISGEKLTTLIAYPVAGKPIHMAPLAYAMFKLREQLKKIRACVVIGYSMRDDHIKDIFTESLRQNPNLKIIIANPDPFTIIREQIKSFALKRACIPIACTVSELFHKSKLWYYLESLSRKPEIYSSGMSTMDKVCIFFKLLDYEKALDLIRTHLHKTDYRITVRHENYVCALGGLLYTRIVARFCKNEVLENEVQGYIMELLTQTAKNMSINQADLQNFFPQSKRAVEWVLFNLQGDLRVLTDVFCRYKISALEYGMTEIAKIEDENEIKNLISEFALSLIKWTDEGIVTDFRKKRWLFERL